jgi:hypothetical protein
MKKHSAVLRNGITALALGTLIRYTSATMHEDSLVVCDGRCAVCPFPPLTHKNDAHAFLNLQMGIYIVWRVCVGGSKRPSNVRDGVSYYLLVVFAHVVW